MNLNDHLIDDASILGIGPLKTEQHPDDVQANGYGTARYWYDVHLVSRTMRIYSDWFHRKDEAQRELMRIWRKTYEASREELDLLISVRNCPF